MLPIRISPLIIALHFFAAVVWILALRSTRREFSREPNSYFFDPHADHFLQQRRARLDVISFQTNGLTTEPPIPKEASTIQRWPKQLCLGVLSDNDDAAHTPQSLLRTLASLTIGLTADERDAIHLVVLLAANDPKTHFAFSQPWLPKMADEVLVYGDHQSPETRLGSFRIVSLSRDRTGRGATRMEQSRLDQAMLTHICRETETFYTALVKPDFVASSDWHIRFGEAVAHIDQVARLTGRDWAFLRLFHGLEGAGWMMQWEQWRSWSLNWTLTYLTFVVVAVSLIFWGFHPRGFSAKAVWHVSFPLLTLAIWVPVAVWLFLKVGGGVALRHHNVGYVGGVREMGAGGCCGHGVVFPKRHLPEVEAMLRAIPFEEPGFAVLETLAAQRGWSTWGMDPSLVV
ncbi:hypothetical protein QBC39DRAFT_62853 [Podospora conica]|nr:hypothetical protein QBC39DRAFT_62853 [Schizothecium conicum]